MVAAAQSTTPTATPVQHTPSGAGSHGTSNGTRSALRGQSFAMQENALAPRGQSFALQENALAPREAKRSQVQQKPAESAPAETVATRSDAGGPAAPTPESGAGELQARVAAWRPALVKATDPVACMTEKSYVNAMNHGKDDAKGFYAQAIGELERLAGEMDALAAAGADLSDAERAEVARMAGVAQAWRGLYGTIRDTGDDPADRDTLTAVAMGAVRHAQSCLDGLGPNLVGAPAFTRMNQSLGDVRTFVGSWSVLAASDSGASKAMWASFLQTTERYRMIMAEYGALEERGGDASGTGKLAVKGDKGMAKDRAEADKAADDSGGYMVLAMQTYSYKAANQAGMQKQIDALTERVFAGEFATLDAAKQAARREIGGGKASAVYYSEVVDHYISAAWDALHGGKEKFSGDISTARATELLEDAREADGAGERALDRTKGAVGDNREAAQAGMLEATDQAWAMAEKHRAQAEAHQQRAESYVSGANGKLDEATRHYAEAHAHLQSAKNHLQYVDPARHPEFQNGIAVVEGKLGEVEHGLGKSEQGLNQAKLLRDEIALRAEAQRQQLDNYQPDKLEVQVPEALLTAAGGEKDGQNGKDGAKGELKSFVKGKLSVDAKIASIITLNGSTECEGGVKQQKGAQWGYLKHEWSLGMSIDLVLFALKAAYVAGSEVSAKDKLMPGEVVEAGEKERSRYTAKRRIHESGSADDLATAFETNKLALTATFDEVKKSAEALRARSLDRGVYRLRVLSAAIAARDAQRQLWADVVGAFVGVSNLWDALMQAHVLLDETEVYDKTLELAEASAKTAPDDVQAHGATILLANEEARNATKKPMDKLNDHTNDPDVTFKDYGGWEFGAEAGGVGYSFGAKFRTVTVTSDGDGDTYDYEDHDVTTVSASFSSREFKGDVAGEWVDGAFKRLSLSGTLAYDGKFDDKKRTTIQAKAAETKAHLKKALDAVKNPKVLAGKLEGLFQDFFKGVATALESHDDIATWKSKSSATPQLMIGFDFKFGDETDISLRLGAGTKVEDKVQAGAFTLKGELTTGTEASIALD